MIYTDRVQFLRLHLIGDPSPEHVQNKTRRDYHINKLPPQAYPSTSPRHQVFHICLPMYLQICRFSIKLFTYICIVINKYRKGAWFKS